MFDTALGQWPEMVTKHSFQQEIVQEIRLATNVLLEQLLKLREDPPPNSRRGVGALGFADRFLKQRSSVGLIIGGIAVELHSNGTPQQLQKHKDLDVMVLSGEEPDRFEGGIDWWYPSDHRLQVHTGYSRVDLKTRCWRNGNGATLCYGAGVSGSIAPGLYLPPSELLVDLLIHEATITVDVVIEQLAIEIFEAALRDTLRSDRPSPLVGKGLFGQLNSWENMASPMDQVAQEVGLYRHDQDVWRKLNTGADF